MEMDSSNIMVDISNSSLTCNHFNNNDGGSGDYDGGGGGDCNLNEKDYNNIKEYQSSQVQVQQQTVLLENNNDNNNVTRNIFKFNEPEAEAEVTTESRMEGITSQCYEGNLSVFSGEMVVFEQTPIYNEEQEEDDEDEVDVEEICPEDPNSVRDDTIQRFARAKKEVMDAFLVVKSQYDDIVNFRRQEFDEATQMNTELVQMSRDLENESNKQKDLKERIEAMRTRLAQKNPTSSESQRIGAEYTKLKESHARAVKALEDENELSENLQLFNKTYGINLGLVADDSSLKALILQKLDPNDEDRPFYIYFEKLNPSGFKAIKICPDFPNSQEILRKSNEDQDFVYLIIKIKEDWIESCTKQS